MNTFAKIAVLASALVMPSLASAAPSDGTYTGSVIVSKGLTLSCGLTATLTTGGTKVTAIALTGGLCPTITFNSLPYNVTSTTSSFVIQNADVNTITSGGCYGNVVGTYTASTITLAATGANAIPPKTGGTGSCSISGTASK